MHCAGCPALVMPAYRAINFTGDLSGSSVYASSPRDGRVQAASWLPAAPPRLHLQLALPVGDALAGLCACVQQRHVLQYGRRRALGAREGPSLGAALPCCAVVAAAAAVALLLLPQALALVLQRRHLALRLVSLRPQRRCLALAHARLAGERRGRRARRAQRAPLLCEARSGGGHLRFQGDGVGRGSRQRGLRLRVLYAQRVKVHLAQRLAQFCLGTQLRLRPRQLGL